VTAESTGASVGRLVRRLPASGGVKDGRFAIAAVLVVTVLIAVTALRQSLYNQLTTTSFLILALFALSLGVVWGYGGLWMFGQSLFFGGSAYTYALYTRHFSETGLLPILAAVGVSIIAAIILALTIVRRLGGIFFALITIILVFVAEQAAQSFTFVGGFNGMTGVPPIDVTLGPAHFSSFNARGMLILVAVLVVTAYLCLALFVRSQMGSALVLVRDNPELAESMGYRPGLYRGVALVLGASLAGLAGVLFAASQGAVFPNAIGFTLSAEAVVWLLVGGQLSLAGPVIASLLLSYVQDSLSSSSIQQRWVLIEGLLLIVVATWAPGGLLDGISRIGSRTRHLFLRQVRPPTAEGGQLT
jgi:ABC-type branched-subunit amino acid transport system permease subunit